MASPKTLFAVLVLVPGVVLLAACGGDEAKGATPKVTVAAPSDGSPTGGPASSPTASTGTASQPAGPHRCGDDPSATGNTIARVPRTGQRTFSTPPAMVIDRSKSYTATIDTAKGVITLELAARDVPVTTNNFVFLACTGYYDGLVFHRVVADFVIQGGDPKGDGTGGPGYRFNNEISQSWKHGVGALAMANAGPNTNGSQFYITMSPQPRLDGSYNVFGRVLTGMDVVLAIRVGDKINKIDIEEK